jgi:4'-phosphopantetheinyl transferase
MGLPRLRTRAGFFPTGEVHIWRASLDQPDPVVEAASRLLSGDEIEHANRGVGAVRRRRILARGALRTALATYLNARPESLSFAYDAFGKPRLTGASVPRQPLFFSLARSGDCCLVAVAESEVGIDVERLERRPDLDRLAERYFAAEETSSIQHLTGDCKVRAFFRCWTCKEALIKAMGGGLATRRLDGLVILLDGDEPVLAASEYGDPQGWTLTLPPIEEPWTAAVALRRPPGSGRLTISVRRLEHDV